MKLSQWIDECIHSITSTSFFVIGKLSENPANQLINLFYLDFLFAPVNEGIEKIEWKWKMKRGNCDFMQI
jgi:hypothetical protein